MEALKKSDKFAGSEGPVVLVIMDGVGVGKTEASDYVKIANTPNMDWLQQNALATKVAAHGTAVGLPSDDDMGNSEVGHNAIGCGRVFAQGAALVNEAIETGAMFKEDCWNKLVANVEAKNSTLHFIGLFSDGNVHSNIGHLEAMLTQAKLRALKLFAFTLCWTVAMFRQHLRWNMLSDSRNSSLKSTLTELLIIASHQVAVVCKSQWIVITRTGVWSIAAGLLTLKAKDANLLL